jgi:phosphoglycolate phosphatase/putative hydrolase of the HAD superfamily
VAPYDLVVFDLDGTLYFQRPVRARMALRLAGHYATHPWRWRELALLRDFRNAREASDRATDEELVADLASRHRLPPAVGRAVLDRWLLTEPLRAVAAHVDTGLVAIVQDLRRGGLRVAVLSDYPTEAKLTALGIAVDAQFCTAEPPIAARKPAQDGIAWVLRHFGVAPGRALMVGDRDDKDGASARAAGVDAVILPRSRRGRRAAVQALRERLGHG